MIASPLPHYQRTRVHLGQIDMSIHEARCLPPKDTIIGVSCNIEEQVRDAMRNGTDDVGIGAIWSTRTEVWMKTNPLVSVGGAYKPRSGRHCSHLGYSRLSTSSTCSRTTPVYIPLIQYEPPPILPFTRIGDTGRRHRTH